MIAPSARAFCVLLFLSLAPELHAQTAYPFTLDQVVERANTEGLSGQAARSTLEAARMHNSAFFSRLLPQLSLSGTAPTYNKSISAVIQPDGSTSFVPVGEMDAQLNMTVSQEIPGLGARLYASSLLNRIEPISSDNPHYWQSTPFVIGIEQNLFQPRTALWDKREQTIDLDVAEQQYLEAREDGAARAAGAFFDLYAAQIAVANAISNAAVNDSLYRISKGRFEVGKIAENDLLQSELAVLRAHTSVESSKLEEDRARAALRLELNIPDDAPLEIAGPPTPLAMIADSSVAMTQALANRSQIHSLELQQVQAKRRVTSARLQNNLHARLTAGFGYNQTAPLFNDAYRAPLQQQRFALQLDMPIMQWGAGHDEVAAARAEQSSVNALAERTRRQVAQDAYFAARRFTLAQSQLGVAAKADTVATRRFDVAKDRYVIGKIDIGDLYIAQTEKDQALVSYVQAVRAYWLAYYQLRRSTLYDFRTGRPID